MAVLDIVHVAVQQKRKHTYFLNAVLPRQFVYNHHYACAQMHCQKKKEVYIIIFVIFCSSNLLWQLGAWCYPFSGASGKHVMTIVSMTNTGVTCEAQALDSTSTLLLQDNTTPATSRTTHNNVPSPYATLLPAQSLHAGEQSVNAGVQCYTDASIPSENQFVGPTPAGIGIYIHHTLTGTVQQL
jgi:hypothetical protein